MAGGRTFKVIFDGDSSGAEAATGRVEKSFDGLDSKLGRLGGTLGDIGKTAAGFALGEGLTKAPGFLFGAAEAAAEDEAATARLNQTLQNYADANDDVAITGEPVADYMVRLKGHANDLIDAGQKLAFSDDDIRDSFGTLLTATGDVDEATLRLAAAQDLARAKNIPLADASKLLGKVTDENLQVFKKMGITLPDVANAGDVLAAVQKKFGGQADAYAKSTAGQFAQAKLALSETSEAIGYMILPAVTKMGAALAKELPKIQSFVGDLGEGMNEKVVPALNDAADAMGDKLAPAAEAVGDKLANIDAGDFADQWDKVAPVIQTVSDLFRPLAEDILVELDDGLKPIGVTLRDDLWPALKEAEPILKPLGIFAGAIAIGPLYLLLQAIKFLLPPTLDFINLGLKVLSIEIQAGMKVYDVLVKSIGFVGDAFHNIGPKVTEFIGFVKDIPTKLAEAPELLKTRGTEIVVGLFTGAKSQWDDATGGIASLVGWVEGIPGDIGDVTKLLFSKGEDVLTGLFDGQMAIWEGEATGIAKVVGWVMSIPDKIGDVGRLLWDKGSDITTGLIGGMGEGISIGEKAVKSAFNGIIGLINRVHIPGIEIPDWVPGIGGNGWGGWNPSVPYLANGAKDFAGGWAVVGEQGPELVNLPRGSNVFSNSQSRAMAGGMGDIHQHFYGPVNMGSPSDARITAGDMAAMLEQRLRRRGSAA